MYSPAVFCGMVIERFWALLLLVVLLTAVYLPVVVNDYGYQADFVHDEYANHGEAGIWNNGYSQQGR